MAKKWLALIGLMFILVAIIIGLASGQHLLAAGVSVPESEGSGLWEMVTSLTGISTGQALALSLIALLLGVALTIPWWRERLQREELWWQERDEPVKGPPRAGV